jgi:hypothetical protein
MTVGLYCTNSSILPLPSVFSYLLSDATTDQNLKRYAFSTVMPINISGFAHAVTELGLK